MNSWILCFHCNDLIGTKQGEQTCKCKSISTYWRQDIFRLEMQPNAKYEVINKNFHHFRYWTYSSAPRDTSDDVKFCEECRTVYPAKLVRKERLDNGYYLDVCTECLPMKDEEKCVDQLITTTSPQRLVNKLEYSLPILSEMDMFHGPVISEQTDLTSGSETATV